MNIYLRLSPYKLSYATLAVCHKRPNRLVSFKMFKICDIITEDPSSRMHVTMLLLSFAYAIFTAPLAVPALLFHNTSNNGRQKTPFRVINI